MPSNMTYNGLVYPFESNLYLAIDELIKGKSLLRLGDGEFFMMEGIGICFQDHDRELQARLIQIAKTESPNLVKCATIRRNHHLAFLKPNILYYPARISRIKDYDFVSRIRDIFKDKNVVAVHHCDDWRIKALMKKSKSLQFILVQKTNCFQEYKAILEKCTASPKDTYFYLSCGPMAKILCWDLHNLGYKVYDLGRFHDKLKSKQYGPLKR